MIDAFDLDERASAGKTLVLPNPPWGVKPPTPIDHYVAPESPPSDAQIATRQLARDIADCMLTTMPDELRATATATYQASQEAARALNAAQAEYAQLQATAPAGMSLDELGQRRLRKLSMGDHIEDIRRQQAADQACTVALDAARWQTEYETGRAIYLAEQRQIREMREEAQRLLEQADQHQIALGNAMGHIHAWVPTPAPIAPVVEPAQPTVLPKRKRLFG
jgi:hypothetical protein